MVELKTLKNMSFRDDGSLTEKDPAKMYLKDEAIKWIKTFDREKGFLKGDVKEGIVFHPYEQKVIEKWIKHFFDISEEDINEILC